MGNKCCQTCLVVSWQEEAGQKLNELFSIRSPLASKVDTQRHNSLLVGSTSLVADTVSRLLVVKSLSCLPYYCQIRQSLLYHLNKLGNERHHESCYHQQHCCAFTTTESHQRLIGKNRIEDSRFFQILKKQAFPFFSTGHFQEVEAIWELNGTTNETYRAKTLASPGRPQKVSMIYLLRFRKYMRPNK